MSQISLCHWLQLLTTDLYRATVYNVLRSQKKLLTADTTSVKSLDNTDHGLSNARQSLETSSHIARLRMTVA